MTDRKREAEREYQRALDAYREAESYKAKAAAEADAAAKDADEALRQYVRAIRDACRNETTNGRPIYTLTALRGVRNGAILRFADGGVARASHASPTNPLFRVMGRRGMDPAESYDPEAVWNNSPEELPPMFLLYEPPTGPE